MSLDKFLPVREHLNLSTFYTFPMKLFPAQTHELKYKHDKPDYCNQLFLQPTANSKGFS